jgi:hypothetical protein
VVWCGVVWCGVVWCGVVWCGVHLANAADMFELGPWVAASPGTPLGQVSLTATDCLHSNGCVLILCKLSCEVAMGVTWWIHGVLTAMWSIQPQHRH